MRALAGCALAALALSGCLNAPDSPPAPVIRVAEAVGSNDHRIFCIGSLTQLMMEPVLWKLEDLEIINFKLPVTVYLKSPLPREYRHLTLKELREGRSGLPETFADPWCLDDLAAETGNRLFGYPRFRRFEGREEFLTILRNVRMRSLVRHRNDGKDAQRRGRAGAPSDIAFALMMLAITDELGVTPQELLRRYLLEPYALRDTSLGAAPSFPVEWSLGMRSSPSDMLKVAYVMLPHLDRAGHLMKFERVDLRHWAYYHASSVDGGGAFLGFDTKSSRAAVVVRNIPGDMTEDGLDLMRTMYAPVHGVFR